MAVGIRLTAAAMLVMFEGVVRSEGYSVVSSAAAGMVTGLEEGGGEGLRMAVKSTADEERCIRARGREGEKAYSPRMSLIVG